MITVDEVMAQASTPFADEYIPMAPGSRYSSFHAMREDYKAIFGGSKDYSNAMRGLEVMADRHREELKIPSGYVPDDLDAWFTASEYKLAKETHGTVSHTKCNESLKYFIARGFLERRFIGRLVSVYALPPATIYSCGKETPYIILETPDGEYIDAEGKRRNAICEGYMRRDLIEWQYRIDRQALVAAIWWLARQTPPDSPTAWKPLTQVWPATVGDPPDPPRQKVSVADMTPITETATPKDASYQTSAKRLDVSRGETRRTSQEPSTTNDNRPLQKSATHFDPNSTSLSKIQDEFAQPTKRAQLHRDTIVWDAEKQSAERTTETIIDLLSQVLDIPAKETLGEKLWRLVVEEPCEWIAKRYAPTVEVSTIKKDLERRVQELRIDPWWKAHCKKILPWHLVGREKIDGKPTGPLTGKNWEMLNDRLTRVGWHIASENSMTRSYESGYIAEDTQSPLPADVSPASTVGNLLRDADVLPVTEAPPPPYTLPAASLSRGMDPPPASPGSSPPQQELSASDRRMAAMLKEEPERWDEYVSISKMLKLPVNYDLQPVEARGV